MYKVHLLQRANKGSHFVSYAKIVALMLNNKPSKVTQLKSSHFEGETNEYKSLPYSNVSKAKMNLSPI